MAGWRAWLVAAICACRAICDSGYTIAVLANVDPPAAGRLADFIKSRLPAK
jgi:hypothetical protein